VPSETSAAAWTRALRSGLVGRLRGRLHGRLRDDLWDDAGSVLLLMPAAVLIVVVLGAIAVDAAVVYLGERQAADLATSVANDAAALVDEAGLYQRDQVCLSHAELLAYAQRRYAAASHDGFAVQLGSDPGDPAAAPASTLDVVDPCVDAGGDPTIEARVYARVPLIFSRGLPGPDHVVVGATTRVRLEAR